MGSTTTLGQGPRVALGRAGVLLVTAWCLAALPPLVLRALGVQHAWRPDAYIPIHTLFEVAIALVGFATFAVQWYAAGARGASGARARFLGAAFLAIGIFHTAHLLAFPGMPGFLGPSATDRGIYYLLLGRFWLTGSLLASAFLPVESERPFLRRGPLLAANLAVVALGIALEIALSGSPGILYRPGVGLTSAKVGVEIVIVGLAVVGAVLHWRTWYESQDRMALRIVAVLGLVALSELSFAMFDSVYDVYNLAGHLYTLVAAALMFDGLFVAAILEPYRRLDHTTRDLAASNARLDALRAHVEGELATTIARLEEVSSREQLARAELEAAIAAVPDGIVVCSADGGILRTNTAADRLMPAGGELAGDTLLERWSRLEAQTTEGKPFSVEENPLVKALQGETVAGVPASIETPGGKRLWVSIAAAPMRALDGRLDGAVTSITDIGAIQELQRQREDLLKAVSHDLRNPLQIVLLQAERLQRFLGGTALEKERVSADRIVRAASQMGGMIRDLVEAARMESGGLRLSFQEVELRPFVERLMEHSAGALDVGRVRLDLAAGLTPARADPSRLERVFLNLVGNALKYTPEGTEVRVTAGAHEGQLLVSVADRGPGIPPKDLPYVFDRFYRGGGELKSDGLGLGLYIVRMLVEAHGGRVWVESRPGEGATFSFTLPAATG